MPALGSTARTTVRGEKNPHVGFNDPLENRAWAVWFAVRNGKVKTSGTASKGPQDRGLDQVDGFVVEVNLTTKMRDLWAELSQADRQGQQAFLSEVRQFLRLSGNAVCLRSPGLNTQDGAQGQPLWWIRDEWNDTHAIGIFRPVEMTDRERRLSPSEAGEDRPAAPVDVRQRDMDAAENEAADGNGHIADIWQDRRNRIIHCLREAVQPLYQLEISEYTGISNWAVGRAVREMIANGDTRIARRLEENEDRPESEVVGRRHYLYWHEAPVPRRDPGTFRHTQTIMQRVNSLQPGRTMTTRWISPGPMKDIQELIDAGLLVLLDPGTENERIMLAPDSDVETLEDAVEETEPMQQPTALTGAGTPLALQIEQMIEAEVQRRGTDSRRVEELTQQLEESETARRGLKAELEELQQRFDVARRAFL